MNAELRENLESALSLWLPINARHSEQTLRDFRYCQMLMRDLLLCKISWAEYCYCLEYSGVRTHNYLPIVEANFKDLGLWRHAASMNQPTGN